MCRVEIFWERLTKLQSVERGEFFTCALKKGGISGIHTFFLFLSQTGTLSSLIPPFDRFHFDKSINPFLRDYSEMMKKKKVTNFPLKHG